MAETTFGARIDRLRSSRAIARLDARSLRRRALRPSRSTEVAPFSTVERLEGNTVTAHDNQHCELDIRCRVNRPLKRAIDLVIGIPAAIVMTPVMLAATIVSAIVFRAWPVFTQERVGQGGKTFSVAKIRSLPRHAAPNLPKHELGQLTTSRWSRFIRRTHIDELPQLWHVISGKMSLIGPRPEMIDLAASFPDDFARERLSVAPGCTGLWQISVAGAGMIGDDTSLDLYYIRQWSLRLEAWIAFRTIGLLLGKDPVRGLEWIPRWARRHHDER